jgi:hypothetical protein
MTQHRRPLTFRYLNCMHRPPIRSTLVGSSSHARHFRHRLGTRTTEDSPRHPILVSDSIVGNGHPAHSPVPILGLRKDSCSHMQSRYAFFLNFPSSETDELRDWPAQGVPFGEDFWRSLNRTIEKQQYLLATRWPYQVRVICSLWNRAYENNCRQSRVAGRKS